MRSIPPPPGICRDEGRGDGAFSRRGALGAGTAALLAGVTRLEAATPIDHGRPPIGARRFTSAAVERAIDRVRRLLPRTPAGDRLASMFAQCFPNTLDTTVDFRVAQGRPDTFVITGDIDAMWLRDSSAQVWPYLGLIKEDDRLRLLIAGVIARQVRCVLIDPYANAFNRGPTGSEYASDLTDMKPELHERKFEVDSLCYPLRLAHGYWRATGDVTPFDEAWRAAARLTLQTLRVMQRKDGLGPYRFQRKTAFASDTAANGGYGAPIRYTGMVASIFRPSDDATIFPFLVPANMMAVTALRGLVQIAGAIGEPALASDADALAREIDHGLRTHATVHHPARGMVLAYEVDGYGGAVIGDDANVPSLLSAPYLGWCGAGDPLYRRTRALVLSEDNPWFFRGRFAEGVGSPHTGQRHVWPLSIIMRGLTSGGDDERLACLRQLMATDAGTGFMHEGFDPNDPAQFTRPWFAWANTIFGELVLRIAAERPQLFQRL